MSTPAARAISISSAISGIDAAHGDELVLRQAVERAAAGDADVGRVLGKDHRPPAARELGGVLDQEQRRARVEVERDVVLELDHPDAVFAGRHSHRASAGRRARVDRGLAGAGRVLRAQAGGPERLHIEESIADRLLIRIGEKEDPRCRTRAGERQAASKQRAA